MRETSKRLRRGRKTIHCYAVRIAIRPESRHPRPGPHSLSMSESSLPPAPSADTPPSGLVPKRILVIDDDDMVRTFVRRALEGEGYIISMAANGYEAMVQFRQFKPDG